MKIFISSSGYRSKQAAEILTNIFRDAFPSIQVFNSISDIQKGESWVNAIQNQIVNTDIGILCITNDNISSPWLNFEAGVLNRNSIQLIPILIDCSYSELKAPLSLFQAFIFEKNDLFRILKTINLQQPESEHITNNKLFEISELILDKYENSINQIKEKKPQRTIKKSKIRSQISKTKINKAVNQVSKKRTPPPSINMGDK